MLEYRGIKLHESVKLYMKNGKFNKKVKEPLDKLTDKLKEKGYVLLGDYINSGSYIDAKCNFGHSFQLKPSKFLCRGDGCNKCSGCCPEQAKEDFYKLAKQKGYKILDDYVNAMTPLNAICDKGHDCRITPNGFKNIKKSHGCQECKKINIGEKMKKKAREKFFLLVKERKHEILKGVYKSNRSKFLIDFKCGHKPHWISAHVYERCKHGGCGTCGDIVGSEKKNKEAREQFALLVESKGHEILAMKIYDQHSRYLIDFKCGHEPHWTRTGTYNTVIYGCPICAGIVTGEKLSESARKDFYDLIEVNGHKALTDYGRSGKDAVLIDFTCKKGHRPHKVSPNEYKKNQLCRKCKDSNGEQIIWKWLDENKIKYISQFAFPSKDKRKAWKYDICIPSQKIIIEVHGLQHYEFTERFHETEKDFIKQKKTDRKKREYAEWLGYKYIEVDYREHKPKLALERFLIQFNEIRDKKSKAMEVKQLSLF